MVSFLYEEVGKGEITMDPEVRQVGRIVMAALLVIGSTLLGFEFGAKVGVGILCIFTSLFFAITEGK